MTVQGVGEKRNATEGHIDWNTTRATFSDFSDVFIMLRSTEMFLFNLAALQSFVVAFGLLLWF